MNVGGDKQAKTGSDRTDCQYLFFEIKMGLIVSSLPGERGRRREGGPGMSSHCQNIFPFVTVYFVKHVSTSILYLPKLKFRLTFICCSFHTSCIFLSRRAKLQFCYLENIAEFWHC